MQNVASAVARRVGVERLSLGDIRPVLFGRVGVVAGTSAHGAPVATVRKRLQGGYASEHPPSSALETAKLSP